MNNMKKLLLMSLIASAANAATLDSNGQWNFSVDEDTNLTTATTVNSTTNGLDLNVPGILSDHDLDIQNWTINAVNNGVSFIAGNGYDTEGYDEYGYLAISDSKIDSKNGFYLRDVGQVVSLRTITNAQNIGVDILDGSFILTDSTLTAGTTGILAKFTGESLTNAGGGYIEIENSTI